MSELNLLYPPSEQRKKENFPCESKENSFSPVDIAIVVKYEGFFFSVMRLPLYNDASCVNSPPGQNSNSVIYLGLKYEQ